MTKLLAISGSLRKGSFNTALMKAAVEGARQDVTIDVGSIAGIPLYNGDLETSEGVPQAVQVLKELVVAADGVILFTPEYNNSIPGVFKNAIDWLSRPSSDIARVFGGRPFAIAGASPGNYGTILSQNAWLSVLHTLGAHVWHGKRLMVPHADKVFDADGRLVDEAIAKRLTAFVSEFADFAGSARR